MAVFYLEDVIALQNLFDNANLFQGIEKTRE